MSNLLEFERKKIEDDEQLVLIHANRNINNERRCLTNMIALRKIYQRHSFDKYDPVLHPQKRNRYCHLDARDLMKMWFKGKKVSVEKTDTDTQSQTESRPPSSIFKRMRIASGRSRKLSSISGEGAAWGNLLTETIQEEKRGDLDTLVDYDHIEGDVEANDISFPHTSLVHNKEIQRPVVNDLIPRQLSKGGNETHDGGKINEVRSKQNSPKYITKANDDSVPTSTITTGESDGDVNTRKSKNQEMVPESKQRSPMTFFALKETNKTDKTFTGSKHIKLKNTESTGERSGKTKTNASEHIRNGSEQTESRSQDAKKLREATRDISGSSSEQNTESYDDNISRNKLSLTPKLPKTNMKDETMEPKQNVPSAKTRKIQIHSPVFQEKQKKNQSNQMFSTNLREKTNLSMPASVSREKSSSSITKRASEYTSKANGQTSSDRVKSGNTPTVLKRNDAKNKDLITPSSKQLVKGNYSNKPPTTAPSNMKRQKTETAPILSEETRRSSSASSLRYDKTHMGNAATNAPLNWKGLIHKLKVNNTDTIVDDKVVDVKSTRRLKRREKTFVLSRERTIFPGECKTTFQMRKFIDKEVSDLIFSMSPKGKRQTQIELLKERENFRLPLFMDKSKPTSAIFREFRDPHQVNRMMTAPS